MGVVEEEGGRPINYHGNREGAESIEMARLLFLVAERAAKGSKINRIWLERGRGARNFL